MKIDGLAREFEAHSGALMNILIQVAKMPDEDIERFYKKIEPMMIRFNENLDKLHSKKDG